MNLNSSTLSPSKARSTSAAARVIPLSLVLFGLGIFYMLLFQSYRAYEIDNAWYLSFSRNFWVDRYGRDFFLNGIFPDGMGGTVVFGRLAAIAQAAVMSHFAWRPLPAAFFSTCLVLLGLSGWYLFLRRSGMAREQSTALVLALGLTEPFVGMAERFRYEPFSFLIMAVAFYMAGTRRPRLALIIGLLALEIQPAAILIFASLFLFLWRERVSLIVLLAGTLYASVCFVCVYFFLHQNIIQVLSGTDWHRAGVQMEFGGFVRAYFVDRKRHFPELVLFVAAIFIYLKHRAEVPSFVKRMAEATALVCVFAFLMRWATSAYMIFFFPFAIVGAGWCLSRILDSRWRSCWALPTLVAVLMLPQYAALAVINRHEGYRDSDLILVANAISENEHRLHLEDAKTQIMGDYSLWYAHPEHYRALTGRTLAFLPFEDMYLCFDGPIQPPAMVDWIVRYCGSVRNGVSVHQVDSLQVRGHWLRILVPDAGRASQDSPSMAGRP